MSANGTRWYFTDLVGTGLMIVDPYRSAITAILPGRNYRVIEDARSVLPIAVGPATGRVFVEAKNLVGPDHDLMVADSRVTYIPLRRADDGQSAGDDQPPIHRPNFGLGFGRPIVHHAGTIAWRHRQFGRSVLLLLRLLDLLAVVSNNLVVDRRQLRAKIDQPTKQTMIQQQHPPTSCRLAPSCGLKAT